MANIQIGLKVSPLRKSRGFSARCQRAKWMTRLDERFGFSGYAILVTELRGGFLAFMELFRKTQPPPR